MKVISSICRPMLGSLDRETLRSSNVVLLSDRIHSGWEDRWTLSIFREFIIWRWECIVLIVQTRAWHLSTCLSAFTSAGVVAKITILNRWFEYRTVVLRKLKYFHSRFLNSASKCSTSGGQWHRSYLKRSAQHVLKYRKSSANHEAV